MEQKTNRLAEVELRLKDSLAERAEEEERLSRRLRDSQEVIASLKAQPHQVKVRSALPSARRTDGARGPRPVLSLFPALGRAQPGLLCFL